MNATASIRLLLLVWLVGLTGARLPGQTREWWIAPGGSRIQSGTVDQPMDSIATALQKWADHDHSVNSLRLILRGGVYFLNAPVFLPDSRQPSDLARFDIEAAPGERPILCGGLEINRWKGVNSPPPGLPANAFGHVWVADAPHQAGRVLNFRELWANGVKAERAREPNAGSLSRLVAWNKTNQIATIPAGCLRGGDSPAGLEMVVDQVWEIAVLRFQSLNFQGDQALVTFMQPESQLEFGHPWPPVIVNATYQAPFYLVNALQFLDTPGEWFEDLTARKIYYWPRAGQDMAHISVIAPALETLLQAAGSAAHPIGNLHFKGITFSSTTWLRPSQQGHVPLQAGMFIFDAHKLSPKGTPYHPKLDNVAWIGRPPAAVALQYATNVTFEDCTFEHLASAGLDIGPGCRDVLVQGCTFRDLGGNGLQLGQFSNPAVETHLPYNPADNRDLCFNVNLRDNLITDCGTEDWGAAGIAAGYIRQLSIQHNELNILPYTGISLGWGWTKMTNALRENRILANNIHHIGLILGDLGGIYTLSAQPGTLIAGNVVADIQPSTWVPDPEHWFYLYADEGSSGITWRDNWCPSAKFLQNANGPDNTWTNNGPEVSAEIKHAAGLEPAFQYLLK